MDHFNMKQAYVEQQRDERRHLHALELMRVRAELAPQFAELERAEAAKIAAQAERTRQRIGLAFAVGAAAFMVAAAVANLMIAGGA